MAQDTELLYSLETECHRALQELCIPVEFTACSSSSAACGTCFLQQAMCTAANIARLAPSPSTRLALLTETLDVGVDSASLDACPAKRCAVARQMRGGPLLPVSSLLSVKPGHERRCGGRVEVAGYAVAAGRVISS
jgi:hypothetical protein